MLNKGSVLRVEAIDGASTSNIVSGTYASTGFISRGSDHSVAFQANGSVWSFGNNASGQLGLGNATEALIPTQIVLDASNNPFSNLYSISSLTTTTPHVSSGSAATAPAGVIALTVTQNDSGELDLSWINTNGSTATAIIIQQQNPDMTWSTIATLNPSQTSFAVIGLTNDQSYSFKVIPQNAVGGTSTTTTPTKPKPDARYGAVIDMGPVSTAGAPIAGHVGPCVAEVA